MSLHIRNGRVVEATGADPRLVDIYLQNGKIVGLGAAPNGFRAEQVIDAGNQLILPGLIDIQARLRDPGQPEKANIESETEAAVKNGITSLCMPPDTQPPIDNSATVELIHHRNEVFGHHARIYPIGALTRGLAGEQLSNMGSLRANGCIAFSNALHALAGNLVQRRAMDYAAGQQSLVIIHPLDHDLMGNGCVHEGAVATRLGLPSIPEIAETAALAKDIELVEQTGARTHFGQLSCARSVEMIRRAKAKGLPITADCAIHQLFLTDHDIGDFNSNALTIPPLRSQYDRDALRAGLADGTIDCLCSDHQPHEVDAKLKPFPSAEAGISGLDTLLALALRLVDEEVLPLGDLIARLTLNPADIFGLPGGKIGVGEVADLIIVDPDSQWICDPDRFISKGKNSPFGGWDFHGSVTHTLIDGKVIYQA
ncbi:MAG: dihydroorotase [Gammaproteobacteria bacterium]|jgi:dihydroorotase|nr:dihydroorotase [Gammaproteobacteria bacterium]